MKLENCKKRNDPLLKNTVMISFRISPKLKAWLHEKQLSIKSICFEACKELGYKHKT